jgi:hypothetical protein
VGGTPGGILLNTELKTADGKPWIEKAFKCGYPKDGGTMTRQITKDVAPGCGCQRVNRVTNIETPKGVNRVTDIETSKECSNWCSATDAKKQKLYPNPLDADNPQHPWLCAWKNTELNQLLKQDHSGNVTDFKYNEIVIGSDEFVQQLPDSVEAFFYPGESCRAWFIAPAKTTP